MVPRRVTRRLVVKRVRNAGTTIIGEATGLCSRSVVPPPAGLTMPTLLAVARSAQTVVPYLSRESGFAIDVVTDVRALSARLRDVDAEDAPSVIVVELDGHAAGPVAQVVRGLRERYPGTPLVMMCDADAPGRDLFRAARAGAEHFVFLPKDNLAELLNSLLASAARIEELHDPRGNEITAELNRPARRIFDAMLSAEQPHESVAALAATLGISTRTFERRAARHGWPAPRLLLLWGRLVRGAAAAGAVGPETALEALLNAAGFPSVEHASSAYARLADVPLSTVLAQGTRALDAALSADFGRRDAMSRPRHARISAA